MLYPVTLPGPKPNAGHMRAAVEVAAITFIDTLARAASPIAPPANFPVVLGNGAGGVGSILVPLAKASGTRVIVLANSATKLDHARSLGADVAVNYRDGTGSPTSIRQLAMG